MTADTGYPDDIPVVFAYGFKSCYLSDAGCRSSHINQQYVLILFCRRNLLVYRTGRHTAYNSRSETDEPERKHDYPDPERR